MALTGDDLIYRIYQSGRSRGLTHEEAINVFGESNKDMFEEVVSMTPTERHYGVKGKYIGIAFISMYVMIGILIFLYIYYATI